MHILQQPNESPKTKTLPYHRQLRLSRDELLQLTQQTATLQQAGMALPLALRVFRDGQRRSSAKSLLTALELELSRGQSLSTALSAFPKTFDSLFQRLVAVGESSGTLEQTFQHLAELLQRQKLLRQKTRQALIQPTAILVVACAVTTLLLLQVVPEFQQLFNQFGRDLPKLTLSVINFSNGLQTHGLGLATLLASVFLTAQYGVRQHQPTRLFAHTLLLRLPVLGQLVTHRSIASIARTLATSLSAGLPIMEALDFARSAPSNLVYAQATRVTAQAVQRGSNLHSALYTTRCFPNLFVQMITVGEQSGMLDAMLLGAAKHYESCFDVAIDRLIPLLEPAMTVILGGLVGILMLAMYLPLFQMGSVLG